MKIELDSEIIKGAIESFGSDAQINMAIEECAELIDALVKYKRGRIGVDAVVTEIADVQIMSAQMELVFAGASKIVEMERMRKMDRLRGRLEKYNHESRGIH